MPRISEFFGIVIAMFYRDHPPPHFHAFYSGHEAVVGIDPIRVLEGELPRRALALVFEWAAIYQSELRQNWESAQAGEPMSRISPLD